jgi:hypothetical protein
VSAENNVATSGTNPVEGSGVDDVDNTDSSTGFNGPKTIHGLNLHEEIRVGRETYAMRVPGGWLYIICDPRVGSGVAAVFVPLNPEFGDERA